MFFVSCLPRRFVGGCLLKYSCTKSYSDGHFRYSQELSGFHKVVDGLTFVLNDDGSEKIKTHKLIEHIFCHSVNRTFNIYCSKK